MKDRITEKLHILSDAAKYDVNARSSGAENAKMRAVLAMETAPESVTLTPKMVVVYRCLKNPINQSLHLRLRLLREPKEQ